MEAAEQIKDALKKYGYQLSLDTPTNQIFCIVSNDVMKKIAQDVEFGFWEKYDETHLSLIHISEPTRQLILSRMPSSA